MALVKKEIKQASKKDSAKLCLTLAIPWTIAWTGSSVHGNPQARILEWVAISFSRGTSWPRNWPQVSHNVGRCFTNWATWEVSKARNVHSHSYFRMYSNIKQQSSTMQNRNWFCTNLIQNHFTVYKITRKAHAIKTYIYIYWLRW